MGITNTAMALGSWSIQLKPETPQDIIDQIQYLGHIAVSTGRPDPRVAGDTLLTSARYVGVLRGIMWQPSGPQLSGSGMAYWLGDENDKGPVITDQLLFTAVDLPTAVAGLMAATSSVHTGTVHSVSLGYTGYHQFVTIRKALDFIVSTVTDDTLNPVEWRVNGDATLDVGRASDLYGATPTAAVVRRHVGADMGLRALSGTAQVTEDVQDYATQVILLGQGGGLAISSAVASLPSGQIPYKDLFGNTVSIKRTVSQSSTNQANSLIQAQLALNQYANPRDAVQVSTDQFDIEGDVGVGHWVWVHDPDASLVDVSGTPAEIVFRGERINPVKLRVTDITWPVVAGMSVAYRGPDGVWHDLTDYVKFETGATTLTVGGYNRSLTNPTGVSETLGSRAAPNTSIPNTPAFQTPFVQGIYQSAATGISKAQVQVRWQVPTNTDGTSIVDGDHYEIRYRTASAPSNPSTWAQAAGKTWAQMGTWRQPINYVPGPWTSLYAPFDSIQLLVQELTPAVGYDFQIRAVDNGTPPNYSAWSSSTTITTNGDTIPPPQPAPPTVASSLISVQVTHLLGAAAGGTFNLPADLHHLEVHGQYEPTYQATPATLLGKLPANNGMILSQTPVVGTFPIQSTVGVYVKVVAVDESGNRSTASTPVQSTAQLIDDSHISNLTVSKLLAGTVTTDWLVGANIQTAASGARAGLNALGLFAYTALNAKSWEVQDTTGDMVFYAPSGNATLRCEASTGNIYFYKSDGVTPTLTLTAATGLISMIGQFTAGVGVGVGPSVFIDPDSAAGTPRPRVRIHHDSGAKHSAFYVRPSATDTTRSRFIIANFDSTTQINGSVVLGDDAGLYLAGGASEDLTTGTSLTVTGANIYLHSDSSAVINGGNGAHINLNSDGSALYGGANNGYLNLSSGGTAQLVSTGSVKSFVIDHPTDADRHLVHACTESPTAGVEYWGTAEIADHLAVVTLPGYFDALVEPGSAIVLVTGVLAAAPRIDPPPRTAAGRPGRDDAPPPPAHPTGGGPMVSLASPSEITGGQFHIVCPAPDGTKVNWLVKATRRNAGFNPEPLRSDVQVHGDGPYRYLTPKEAP